MCNDRHTDDVMFVCSFRYIENSVFYHPEVKELGDWMLSIRLNLFGCGVVWHRYGKHLVFSLRKLCERDFIQIYHT